MMMQLVNALPVQKNTAQPSANEPAASAADFKSLLAGQQNGQSVQSGAANPAQERLTNEKQTAEALSIEGIADIPEAIRAIAKEWMADGKFPSFEELAAFLGMSTAQLQENIQRLIGQISHLADAEQTILPAEERVDGGQSQQEEQLPPVLSGNEEFASLLQAVQSLAAVPAEKWTTLDEKAVQTVLTAGKLLQLLGEQADSTAKDLSFHATIKNSMKEIADKLDKLLVQPQTSNRTMIIQRAFQNFLQPHSAGKQAPAAEPEDGQVQQKLPAAPSGKEGTVHMPSFFHQLGRTETFSLSVHTNPRPMNMEQFIEKFSQVLGNSNLVKMPNGTKLLIRLYPEQLGSLRIELLQQNGMMTAKILSSTSAVKELFEQHVSSLKHAFGQQNINVDKIELTFSQAEPQKFDRQQQQQQSRQQQQMAQPTETDDEPAENFQDLLLNMEV
ncbi:flagellar hook-length control protein FliK [Bacillus badius]|uniref:flagellar hook-length control protein FliK n=1 Tax=Bacillus badius TaxID=1455 RepID=UPI002E2221F5|nr:flagellar hook-length control protein FliK [Bacillus badius]